MAQRRKMYILISFFKIFKEPFINFTIQNYKYINDMKYTIVVLATCLLTFSCGEKKKQETPKQPAIETVKKKPVIEEKTNVTIDSDGVANVLITTNDAMKFDIRKIKVTAGQKIKLTLTHKGKLDKTVMGHNVVFLKKDVKISSFAVKSGAFSASDYVPEESEDVIAHTKIIGGGETTVIEFIAPEKGTYNYICSFPGHYAMMKGRLIVE